MEKITIYEVRENDFQHEITLRQTIMKFFLTFSHATFLEFVAITTLNMYINFLAQYVRTISEKKILCIKQGKIISSMQTFSVRRFLCKQVRENVQKCVCGCVRISVLLCVRVRARPQLNFWIFFWKKCPFQLKNKF